VCDIYETLIREVVGPEILQHYEMETTVIYQFPPTLRIYCSCPISNDTGDSKTQTYRTLGRMHSDDQYGHQPGEINFWLPLTPLRRTSTLWVESAPLRADWHPLLLPGDSALDSSCGVGPLFRFHGCCCRHFTKPNDSGETRVSFDFRVAAKGAFDASWSLPSVKHKHDLREMVIHDI
jgi:hypothetical protein